MASPQEHLPKGLFKIQEDLEGTWLEDLASAGIVEIEEFLGKHAAFLAYMDEPIVSDEPAPEERPVV
jgi:hypothetical protein